MINYKSDKKVDIFSYVILIAVVYLSANPIFHMIYYKQSVFVVLFLSFLYWLFNSNIGFKFNKYAILVFAFFCFSLLCTAMLDITSGSTYFGIAVQIFSAFLICHSIGIKKFEEIYVKLISFLMMCSLFFYFAQMVFPNIWNAFPKEQGAHFTYVNVMYLYNYFWLPSEGNYILPRNSGVFWEPGCYQFFLNLALLIMLHHEKEKGCAISRKTFYLVLLYIITIITTKSTTGLFLAAIIISLNAKYLISLFISKSSKFVDKIFVFLVLLILIFVFFRLDFASDIITTLKKINNSEYMDGNGLVERLSLNSIWMVFENWYRLFGVSFSTLYSLEEYTVWNSIIEDAVALGISFVAFTLVGVYKYSKNHFQHKYLFFVICIISLSAEALFHTIFIFCLMFYGYLEN